MKILIPLCACSLITLAGCASNLQVYDGDTLTKGIPFRVSEQYVESGVYTKNSKTCDACDKTPYVKPVSMATGDTHFINIKPAQLAKSGLVVKLTDAGQLAEVDLNTEPSAGVLKDSADALSTVAPLIGIQVPDAGGSDSGGAPVISTKPACDTGPDPDSVKYKKLVVTK